MAEFQTMYVKSCKAMSMNPHPRITEACESRSTVLDLSNNCLTPEHCSLIGKCLHRCHHFSEVNFSDCMMGDKGLWNLFNSLKSDCQLHSVILKGNNICGKGAKLIGRILKISVSLERLSLEWNNVGTYEEGFRELCEGLALNTSLQYLDLRSNNIDHNGAVQLASAFVSNNSLLEVDLRWNNIGVIGGRALLSSLARNHTLLTLSVEGSNVPGDMVEAIGTTISLRFAKHVSDLHHKAENLHLSERLKQLHVDKKHQIGDLLKKLDTERSLFLETTQLSQYEMAEMKAKLEENEVLLHSLEQRLESSQIALQQSQNEYEKLKESREAFKAEMDTRESKFIDEIASLKKNLGALQEEHEHCIKSASSNESSLRQQISAITSEKEQFKEKSRELSDVLDSIKREHAHELSSLQNHCLQVKEQHTQHLKQLHDTHQKEILVHMKRYDEHQAECHKRISNYDEKVLHLEQEVSSLSQKVIVTSRQATEDANQSGQSLRTQEIQNKSLRDQVDAVVKAANKDKEKLKEVQLSLAHLQDEVNAKELQIKESKLKIQELTKQLECANREHQLSKDSHHEEVERLSSRFRSVSEDIAHLKQEYNDFKGEHHRMELCHKKEMVSWMGEKEELQRSVEHYKHLLQKLQDEEAHRTLMLKTALQSYLSTSPKLDVK